MDQLTLTAPVVIPDGAGLTAADMEGSGPFAGRLVKWEKLQFPADVGGENYSAIVDDYGNSFATPSDKYDFAKFIDVTYNARSSHFTTQPEAEKTADYAAAAICREMGITAPQSIVGAAQLTVGSPIVGLQPDGTPLAGAAEVQNFLKALQLSRGLMNTPLATTDADVAAQGWVHNVPFTVPGSGYFNGRMYASVHMWSRIAVFNRLRDRDDGGIVGTQILGGLTGSLGGALSGAGIGNLAGPVGVVVGLIVGAVIGGTVGGVTTLEGQAAAARGAAPAAFGQLAKPGSVHLLSKSPALQPQADAASPQTSNTPGTGAVGRLAGFAPTLGVLALVAAVLYMLATKGD